NGKATVVAGLFQCIQCILKKNMTIKKPPEGGLVRE
ncbi:MAG: hypothetical protein CFH43_01054, partial [Proteobacteria bacterium]